MLTCQKALPRSSPRMMENIILPQLHSTKYEAKSGAPNETKNETKNQAKYCTEHRMNQGMRHSMTTVIMHNMAGTVPATAVVLR